jgi:hypothetical protein
MLTVLKTALKGRDLLANDTRVGGEHVWGRVLRLGLFCVVITSGYATQQDFLNQSEPAALGVAQNRAQFELNCPTP